MAKSKPKLVEQTPGYCGPASLVSLLDFYGIEKNEEELARLCGTMREEGTYHVAMVNVLTGLGFNVVAKEGGTWEELKRLMAEGVPVLVGWFSDDPLPAGDHFSLVYRVDDERLWMMDPEEGKYREIKKEKFLKNWYDFDTSQNKLVKGWYLYVSLV